LANGTPPQHDRLDVGNFDRSFTREPAVLTPVAVTGALAEQDEFEGFDYAAPWVESETPTRTATVLSPRATSPIAIPQAQGPAASAPSPSPSPSPSPGPPSTSTPKARPKPGLPALALQIEPGTSPYESRVDDAAGR